MGMLMPGKSHSSVVIETSGFHPSTYLLPLWSELDRWWDHKGGSLAGPGCCSRPIPGPHWSIDITGGGMPEKSQNIQGRGLQGECDRGSTMADRPPDDGPGNCCTPSPCQMLLDSRSTSREDGHAKWWAAAGSLVLWCTCRNADVERDQGIWSPTSPLTLGTETPEVKMTLTMALF